MRILLLSDIHGSYEALDKIKSFIINENINKIIILGDTYSSPYFKSKKDEEITKILEYFLFKLHIELILIKGNCDGKVAYDESPVGLLDHYELLLGDKKYLCYHGHRDYSYLASYDGFIHGHSHVHAFFKEDGKVFINPGSISRPRDFTNGSFIIMSEKILTIFDMDFNVIFEDRL